MLFKITPPRSSPRESRGKHPFGGGLGGRPPIYKTYRGRHDDKMFVIIAGDSVVTKLLEA